MVYIFLMSLPAIVASPVCFSHVVVCFESCVARWGLIICCFFCGRVLGIVCCKLVSDYVESVVSAAICVAQLSIADRHVEHWRFTFVVGLIWWI